MSIFKAYDIRGVYNKDLNEETAYKLGRSFVLFFNKKNPKIVLAKDGRLSSPSLFTYLKKGVLDQGGTVYDVGLSTTPMLYFADCFLKTDGGIIVTASHNPKEHNGFKIVGKSASPIGEETGLKEIKKIFKGIDQQSLPKKRGKVFKKSVFKEYIKDVKGINSNVFKIGVDTGNSVSGILIGDIFKESNFKINHINKEIDGNFPSHAPDPSKAKNLKQIINLVKTKKLDLGIVFDGDGDRIVFIDEEGKVIASDIILALIADMTPKKVLCDYRCSNILKDVSGDKLIYSRVGHSFIKQKMKEDNIYLGGEYSGHFYLNEGNCFENPFFVLFKILEQMSLSQKKLSELVKPYQKYYHSGEIDFEVKDAKKIIKKIEEKYKKGKKIKKDGLRIDFDDWWFLLRVSNTEPILRLIVEAKTKKLLKEKEEEIKKIIKMGLI